MRTVPLGELVTVAKGKKPADVQSYDGPNRIRLLQIEDLRGDAKIQFAAYPKNSVLVHPADIAIAWDGANAGTSSFGLEGIIGSTIARLRISDLDVVDTAYIGHFLRTNQRAIRNNCTGATIPHIDGRYLKALEIPLPPLEEQRRIAAILDQASSIGQQCLKQIDLADRLKSSLINSRFQGRKYESAPLSLIAQVSSGITKGRKTNTDTRLVPYLAVANVQDGFLDLSNVKEIAATDGEISRYELAPGDLVLTEGGDPDKLGRGTVWKGEIKSCIHQNHIFRVRMEEDSAIRPEVLSAFMRSTAAKSFFLRSAKQTTGIASINMTQLKSLPVPLMNPQAQLEFSEQLQAIGQKSNELEKRLSIAIALERSLQARAFRGEL